MAIPRASELEKKYRIRSQGNLVRDARLFGPSPEVAYLTSGLVILAIILLVASVLLIGFVNPEFSSRPQQPQAYDPLLDDTLTVPLPFGAVARKRCLAQCAVSDQVCRRSCDFVSAAEYARQILPEERQPLALARSVAEDCDAQPAAAPIALDRWKRDEQRILDVLTALPLEERIYEGVTATQKHRLTAELAAGHRAPSAGDAKHGEFARKVQKLLCLRQATALTQLAVFQVGRALDTFSERFYRSVEDGLIAESRSAARAVEADARRVLGSGGGR